MNDEDLMDLFAGMAIQGLLAGQYRDVPQVMARYSYAIAEAMVKEREVRDERLRSTQGN
jgi:hypothetical protein